MAQTFKKSCGQWTVEVSNPWPFWVSIERDGEVLRGFRSDELPDLMYLLEQASMSALAKDEKALTT